MNLMMSVIAWERQERAVPKPKFSKMEGLLN